MTGTDTLVRDQYYRTVDIDGNENENPEGSDGYYIDITKDSSSVTQLDLYPVFDEARWLYFNTGKSGNGASYVGAAYRLTNDERQPEDDSTNYYFDQSFFENHMSSRPGYDFKGWYVFANVDSDGNITNIDHEENVTITYLDDSSSAQTTSVSTKAIKVVNEDGSIALPDGYVHTVGGQKIFEVTDGKLRFYKALDDLTLFADWEAKTVDYTVVYWLQNADDDGYTLMYYRTEKGSAGAQTAALEIGESWTDGEGNNIYSDNKLKFCHLSEDQDKAAAGNQAGIQQQYIEGDGSTIVNVYYDRDVYTLRFDIGFARQTSQSGSSTTYSPMTEEQAQAYTETVYGVIDGAYVALTPDGNGGWTYAGTETVRHDYIDERYKTTTGNDTPQYGVVNGEVENLDYESVTTTEHYLSQNNYNGAAEYNGTIYDANSNEINNPVYPNTYYRRTRQRNQLFWLDRVTTVNSWTYNNGTNYGSGTRYLRVDNDDSNTTYTLGFIDGSMMSEDLILTGGSFPGYNRTIANVNPNQYTAVTINGDNTITHEHGITQEFRCRYTSLNGAKKYLYRIYLADPDTREYPTEPTDKFVITAGSGSNPNLQTPPTYHGYTLADTRVLSSNGSESTPGSSYSDYAIPELTAAGVGNGMIMQFKFMPNEHTITYMFGSGSPAPNTEVEADSSRTYYYDQSIAGADIYTDTVVADTPVGYEFAGWYENPDGIGDPFNFNTMMPDGDIILYAVYKPLRYRININPNGGEIDHIDHTGATYVVNGVTYAEPLNREGDTGYNRSQATYINASYGTEISEYSIARKYVPISDAAAAQYDGTIYYYINTQYHGTDGSGLPSDCRNALYVTESQLETYYNFYRDWTQANIDGGYITGTTVLDYGTWKSLYVSSQKYRTLNSTESWTFLGWYKDGENMPYNFSDPVTGELTLTAHWRLDGGY